MPLSFHHAFSFGGRLLLALLFVLSGPGKVMNADATASYMATGGIPEIAVLAMLVGLFEVVAGLALVIGFKTRAAALSLAVFTFGASIVFHAYWAAPAEQQFIQQLLFMKNMAVVGGLMTLVAFGASGWSLDSRATSTASPSFG